MDHEGEEHLGWVLGQEHPADHARILKKFILFYYWRNAFITNIGAGHAELAAVVAELASVHVQPLVQVNSAQVGTGAEQHQAAEVDQAAVWKIGDQLMADGVVKNQLGCANCQSSRAYSRGPPFPLLPFMGPFCRNMLLHQKSP
jgi:hypothetical protein